MRGIRTAIHSPSMQRNGVRRNSSRSAVALAAVLCLMAWAAFSPAARAQGLRILSTTPTDSSTGVPLETGIEIQFDAAIDTTTRSADGLPIGAFIGPRDSLVIRQHRTEDDRTKLTMDVAHTPDTDFTWIVTGAEGADTTSLDIPYVFRYTTASDWGAHAVRGIVFRYWLVKRGDLDPDPRDVVVALLDEPLTVDSVGTIIGFDRIVAAAAVPEEDGEFVIDRVRNGTYWPVAFIDIDGNGRINGEDRVASYGDHNDITVDGEDVDDVHIDMYIGGNMESPEHPSVARLGEVYPNPTRSVASVEMDLTRPARVNLGLFNILGQQVHAVVEAEFMPSGSHQIRLDASSLAAGTYICRLQVGGATQSRLIFVTR